jgi:hypothetical protein
MKKVIKTDREFNIFCDNDSVIFKLPQENSEKHYILLNTCASEASAGFSNSGKVIDKNWELKSYQKDTDGTWMLVFEIWANSGLMQCIEVLYMNRLVKK